MSRMGYDDNGVTIQTHMMVNRRLTCAFVHLYSMKHSQEGIWIWIHRTDTA